jgi:hypothetical protein
MRLDGYCELDCGEPATEAVSLPVAFAEKEREEHYFCRQHASELRALATDLRTTYSGAYSKPCPCGAMLAYQGEDRSGRDVWYCQTCDHRE